MRGQRQVEPVSRQDVHPGPAGECDQQPKQATDSKENNGYNGIGLDQVFC